jgi:hypothetical protein
MDGFVSQISRLQSGRTHLQLPGLPGVGLTLRRLVGKVEFVLKGDEASIRAQRIELRFNFEENQSVRPVGICLFEPVHSQIAPAQPQVHDRNIASVKENVSDHPSLSSGRFDSPAASKKCILSMSTRKVNVLVPQRRPALDCALQGSAGIAAWAGSGIRSCSVLAPINALATRESQRDILRRLVWEFFRLESSGRVLGRRMSSLALARAPHWRAGRNRRL